MVVDLKVVINTSVLDNSKVLIGTKGAAGSFAMVDSMLIVDTLYSAVRSKLTIVTKYTSGKRISNFVRLNCDSLSIERNNKIKDYDRRITGGRLRNLSGHTNEGRIQV